jgi:hypothetical protein
MIPARETLRAAYDAVIEQINSSRGSEQLTNAFYSKIGDAIFEACYGALENSEAAKAGLKTPKALQVVSAPMGAGKTTFTLAFITAFVRLRKQDPDTPCGCVFLVEQMTKADEMYCELSALLPGKVAVWSTDHDANCNTPTKVHKPAARFHVHDLENHEVVIATHAFYKGKRGPKTRSVVVNGEAVPRALTIIDEQSEDVSIFQATLSGATDVLEAVQQDERSGDIVAPYVHALVKFMTNKALGGSLEKPSDDPSAWADAATELAWFTTSSARDYERERKDKIAGLDAVFGFARALTTQQAFIGRYNTDASQFIGYDLHLELCPGMVLLDATADIDGITPLCRWRSHVDVPRASYANLSIIHVPCFTRQKLSTFLKHVKNRRVYVDWMKQTILVHTELGQRALVVCKKRLFDDRNVPDWPERDRRFERPEAYQQEYAWSLEGRKLCATHWGGLGIGVSTWRDADVVFLFDEFHRPRRVTVARAQGLLSAKATEGPLARMNTLNSKSAQVDSLHEGHLLRWTKQMALRGKGRNFDEHGVCGHQKVVCAGSADQYERLVANAPQLFPGAKIATAGGHGSTEETYAEKLLALLSTPGLPNTISTKWIGEQVGAPWRDWGRKVLKRPETQACLQSLGWRYVPSRGPGGAKLLRDTGGAVYTVAGALETVRDTAGNLWS